MPRCAQAKNSVVPLARLLFYQKPTPKDSLDNAAVVCYNTLMENIQNGGIYFIKKRRWHFEIYRFAL